MEFFLFLFVSKEGVYGEDENQQQSALRAEQTKKNRRILAHFQSSKLRKIKTKETKYRKHKEGSRPSQVTFFFVVDACYAKFEEGENMYRSLLK